MRAASRAGLLSALVPWLWLALSGCAAAHVERAWVDDAKLKYDPSRYPDDAAVVLYRADKTALVVDNNDTFTRTERHEALVVRGEAGFWLAEVSVPYRATDTLLGFRARILQPDGSQREFDAKAFLSDVSAKGERSYSAHFFRFPDVRVGSVLEYWWVVQGEKLRGGDEQETLGAYPVQHYEFELTAAKPLVVETIEFNGAAPIEVRTQGNGDHQLRFALRDLPPREKADFMPHFTFLEPRWAWRVVAWKGGAITYDWFREWTDVVERTGEKLYLASETRKGFDLKLDKAGCDDVPCLAQRAMALINARVVGGGKWDRLEPLGGVLASGKASITERALMLHVLLEGAGVTSSLAFGTDDLSLQVAPTFPRAEQFNHAFVYLPAQQGLATATTIDPSCSFCRVGTLTARHRDTRLFVFKTANAGLDAKTTGQWVTANAAAAPTSERRFTHVAKLDAQGVVVDRVTTRTSGLLSERDVETFTHQPTKLLKREADTWADASPRRVVSKSDWGACERSAGQCEWTTELSFPGHAWKTGDGWALQLGFLSGVHSELFDAEERQFDVHFSWDDTSVVEVLELEAPKGLTLANPSPAQTLKVGSLRAMVEVERTPTGARVTRRLDRALGVESKLDYAELRAVADTFKRARSLVLVFKP